MTLYYAPAFAQLGRGALGFEPVDRPGAVWMLVYFVPVVFVLLVMLVVVMSASAG